MKNYRKMTLAELRSEAMATGINPLGMTKAELIRWLEGTAKASTMTADELLDYIIKSRRADS